MSSDDYVRSALADLPDFISVTLLSQLTGISEQRIYARRVIQKSDKDKADVLPPPFLVPNSKTLRFTKAAVIDWFLSINTTQEQVKPVTGCRGRPLGSKNRKGKGRQALESAAR